MDIPEVQRPGNRRNLESKIRGFCFVQVFESGLRTAEIAEGVPEMLAEKLVSYAASLGG
jgi:hypothetical protein